MYTSTRSAALAAALFLFAVVSTSGSYAALIERDLVTAGDGLITYDTTTGLEWLDTAVVGNLEPYDVYWGWLQGRTGRVDAVYDDVIGGWAAATFDQVRGLFGTYSGVYANFLDSTPIGDRYFANLTGVSDMSGLNAINSLIFGRSVILGTPQIYFGGNLVFSAGADNLVGYLTLATNALVTERKFSSYQIMYDVDPVAYGLAFSSMGAFLVRQGVAVPVTSPLWLVLLGLLVLSARGVNFRFARSRLG